MEEFTRSITNILDRPDMAPVRKFQCRHHYASLLSDETKNLMVARDEATTRYTRTQLPEDWEAARKLRNQVTRLLKSEKSNDARKKIQDCEEEKDSGRVWKNIRSYLGWGGNSGTPIKLTDTAGQLITSPAAMAQLQKNFYVKKVEKIRAQLPKQGDPTATLRQSMEARPHPRPAGLAFKCVAPQKVDNIIKRSRTQRHVV